MSSEEDINTDSSPDSPRKHNVYMEPKAQPKIIRVLTVLAYILSVSMAAILLSIYYIFMWNEHKYYQVSQGIIPTNTASVYEMVNETLLQMVNATEDELQREMQQQLTEVREDELLTTSSSTLEENTTSPDYDSSLDKTFIKKLMYKYPYD